MRFASVALPAAAVAMIALAGCSSARFDPLPQQPCDFLSVEDQDELFFDRSQPQPGRRLYALQLDSRTELEVVRVAYVDQPIDAFVADENLVPTADFGELVQYRNTEQLPAFGGALCLLAGPVDEQTSLALGFRVSNENTYSFRSRETDPCVFALQVGPVLAERLGI